MTVYLNQSEMTQKAFIEEFNQRAENVKELEEENRKLKNEIEALKDALHDLEVENKELKSYDRSKIYYRDGMIDGLKFAIRCNGVSGSDIQ